MFGVKGSLMPEREHGLNNGGTYCYLTDGLVNSTDFKVTMSGLEAVGGVVEAKLGVLACTTVVLCFVGGAMFVDGSAHAASGALDVYALTFGDKENYGQNNFLKNAAKEISPEYGETVYNVGSAGLNLAGGAVAAQQAIRVAANPATAEELLAAGSQKFVGTSGTTASADEAGTPLGRLEGPPDPSAPGFPEPGAADWPPESGFASKPQSVTLQPGTLIDRFGLPDGKYTSPFGTPFPERALPPGYIYQKEYSVYRVVQPLEVKAGSIAPAFGQPGEGTQYLLPKSVESLMDSSSPYLKEIVQP